MVSVAQLGCATSSYAMLISATAAASHAANATIFTAVRIVKLSIIQLYFASITSPICGFDAHALDSLALRSAALSVNDGYEPCRPMVPKSAVEGRGELDLSLAEQIQRSFIFSDDRLQLWVMLDQNWWGFHGQSAQQVL